VWRKLERYVRESSGHRLLLCEALIALAIARIAMAILPFRRIAAWLGTAGAESLATITDEQLRLAHSIGWAVGILGRRVPWDARCLAQALAATSMLRRRGMEGTVSFGARLDKTAGFEAHAWLSIGSYVVTGEAVHEQFKTFTSFSRKHS
jgi:hypothetical protein